MRPQSLTPLFAQVTALPGIGPRLGKLVEKLAGPLVVDLLWHLPFAVIDRRNAPDVAGAKAGEVATLTVVVDEHLVPHSPRQPYRVWCSDETGRLCLTYFNGREDYLRKLLPPGETRVVSGKVEIYQGEVQMTHPDHVVPLDQRGVGAASRAGLWADRRPDAEARAEGHRRRRRTRARTARMAGRGLSRQAALAELARRPRRCPCANGGKRPVADASGAGAACLRRTAGEPARDRPGAPSQPHAGGPRHRGRWPLCARPSLSSLPFDLTASQKTAVEEIATDMAQGRAHDPACCKAMSAAARPWWRCSPC